MNAVTAEQMRELDRRTTESYGVPGEELMDRAGCSVAAAVQRLADAAGLRNPRIQVFAGRGNNGGDAFVAARCLKAMQFDVEVFFAGDLDAVCGDALTFLRLMQADAVPLQALETVDAWGDLLHDPLSAGDILVDGLLGTGARGPARGPTAGAIQVINRFALHALVVAIDIPSGLNADTGLAEGDAVVADVTITMGRPKKGMLEPAALAYVGNVEVADIGIPEVLTAEMVSQVDLITPADLAGMLPRRPIRSHKGTFGHVMLIGGAPGYGGAISMAAMAALRSGVGRVSVLTPASVATQVALHAPEAMVHAGAVHAEGGLSADAVTDRFLRMLDGAGAVLIGPGMTAHPAGADLILAVLRTSVPVVVLDADALNLVAAYPGLLDGKRAGVILTPHPGEMARLTGWTAVAVEQDRFGAARTAAERFGAVAVLKGAGTVVMDGRRLWVNLSGNPGMACGGMGDVLAGFMAGLAAQGLAPGEAACAAVHLHGCAGDDVAWASSQAGMTAMDVIEALPHVFRLVQAR